MCTSFELLLVVQFRVGPRCLWDDSRRGRHGRAHKCNARESDAAVKAELELPKSQSLAYRETILPELGASACSRHDLDVVLLVQHAHLRLADVREPRALCLVARIVLQVRLHSPNLRQRVLHACMWTRAHNTTQQG